MDIRVYRAVISNVGKHITLFASVTVISFLVIPTLANAQQAFTYSQYMNNQTPLNQAYSLIERNGVINALLRKQWVGIEGAPTTFLFDATIPVSDNSKAGLVVMNDKFSIEGLTEINGFFAKAINITKNNKLGVALSAGIKNYTAAYSQLDNHDPLFREDVRQTKPNFGFGVVYFSDHYFLGLSVPELTIANLGNASIKTNTDFKNHYNFSGAYLIDGSDGFKIKPAFLAQYTSGVPVLASFSTTFFVKDTFGIGIDYRSNNEVSGLLSFMTNQFRLGYSYEFGASKANVGGFTNATQEISLSYRFGRFLNISKLRG